MWYYFQLLIYSKSKLQKEKWGYQNVFKGQMYNKLNAKTDVAIGMTRFIQQQSTYINFGFRHKHSDNLVLKARVKDWGLVVK